MGKTCKVGLLDISNLNLVLLTVYFMVYSCPSTSSSSKDSGSEEEISLTHSMSQYLGIPDHPSWIEPQTSSTPRLKSALSKHNDDPLHDITGIIDPFNIRSRSQYRVLKLPILEKTSYGRFVPATKKKTVRFSSPLVEEEDPKATSVSFAEELFGYAHIENASGDEAASSVYDSPSSAIEEDVSSLEYRDDLQDYEEESRNHYLDFADDRENVQPRKYSWAKPPSSKTTNLYEPKTSLKKDVEIETRPKFKNKEDSPAEIESITISSTPQEDSDNESDIQDIKHNVTQQVESSATSCETPILAIFKKDVSSSAEFVTSIREFLQTLATAVDDSDESTGSIGIDEETTLGKVFDMFMLLAGKLIKKLHDMKTECESSDSFNQKEITGLNQEIQKLKDQVESLKAETLSKLKTSEDKLELLNSQILTLKDKSLSQSIKINKLIETDSGNKKKIDDLTKDLDLINSRFHNYISGLAKKLDIELGDTELISGKPNRELVLSTILDEISKVRRSLEDERAQSFEQRLLYKSTIEDLRNENSHLSQKNRSLSQQNKCLKKMTDKLQVDINLQDDTIREQEQRIESSRKFSVDEKKLKLTIEEQEQSIRDLESEKNKLSGKVDYLELRQSSMEKESETNRDKSSTLEAELDEKDRELLERKSYIEDLQMQIREYIASISCLEKERNRALKDLEKQTNDKIKLQMQVEELQFSTSAKAENINALKEKCLYQEQKLNSVSDALSEKLLYIFKLESDILGIRGDLEASKSEFGESKVESKNQKEFVLQFYKLLLESLSLMLSKVLVDNFIPKITEAFDRSVQLGDIETMTPFFTKTNEVIVVSVQFIISTLKKYSQSLSMERLTTANILRLNMKKELEMKKLEKRYQELMKDVSEEEESDSKTVKNMRRTVSDKGYLNHKSEGHSCSTCLAKKQRSVSHNYPSRVS